MVRRSRPRGAVNATLTPHEGGKKIYRVFSSEYKARKYAKDNGYKVAISP